MPEIIGVAMDVPLYSLYPEPGIVEYMATPGASISGFIVPMFVGPRELKPAIISDLSDAPTVIALLAVPGLSIVSNADPEFPAAITGIIPKIAALSIAFDNGSSGSPLPPKLIEIISAWSSKFPSLFGSALLSIADNISASLHEPPLSHTLYARIFASGATPLIPEDDISRIS